MPHSRRALLCALGACALAPAAAETPSVFWPVVTDHPEWDTISAQPACARLRCFGAPRPVSRLDNPSRHHVGVDLFAHAGDKVVAIEDGQIIRFYPFLRARTGEMSYALLIAHAGYIANYGEVRADALAAHGRAIGDRVEAGAEIARISDTAQLHFETYQPGMTHNRAWRHGAPQPNGVIDPTPRLLDLVRRGARLRP